MIVENNINHAAIISICSDFFCTFYISQIDSDFLVWLFVGLICGCQLILNKTSSFLQTWIPDDCWMTSYSPLTF